MSFGFVFHNDVNTDFAEAYKWYEDQQEGLGKIF